jgi:hypothetical protein
MPRDMQIVPSWNPFRAVVLALALGGANASVLAAADSAALADGQFVSVRDGHLSYRGERLRLWGTNFVCFVRRQGADLELSFERLRDAGFNGIRVNLFDTTFLSGTPEEKARLRVPVTVKGSHTPMDLLDRSIYLAKQRGMFFWLSFGTAIGPDNYVALPDDGSQDAWQAMMRDGGSYAMYYDERAERTFQEYAKSILQHLNPYTGKCYADEEAIGLYEIYNENDFVDRITASGAKGLAGARLQDKWNAWLRQQYQTEGALVQAWGKLNADESLEKGTVLFAPITEGAETYGAGVQREFVIKDAKTVQRYPAKRAEDIVRFACSLYTGHSRRFVEFVRSLGQPGRGISVVPVAYTGRYGNSIPTYYAASGGDVVSLGLYGFAMRPWEMKKTDPTYPFRCVINYHPAMEQPIDLFRVKDKPCLIYECNDTRPSPYCTEFPTRMMAHGIWQDLDGVFWFNWDDAGFLPTLKTDADYVTSAIPMPNPSYPNAGLIQANDEAMLATLKAVGTVFRAGVIPPAANPVQVTFGKDLLFELAGQGLGRMAGELPLLNVLREKAWRYGLEVTYDPEGPSQLPDGREPHGVISMGPYMRYSWNGQSGAFVLDAPAANLFTGFLPEVIRFHALEVRGIDQPFGIVAVVAEDGQPLETSASLLVVGMRQSRNTGMELTPEKLATTDYFQQGLAQMCGQPGGPPVITDRVSMALVAPWLRGLHYQKFSFARSCFAEGEVAGDQFVLPGTEPTFYARLTRRPAKVVRKLLVTGNSITSHPPLADSDWNNTCGMAASSLDKDFAHLVHHYITLHQAATGVAPELEVANFPDAEVIDPARHAAVAARKADVVIIEIGDNLKDDPQTEATLGIPYEQLIRTIKQANPGVIVVCTSTWGSSQKKDPLMQAAAARAGAVWVRIDTFIGDPANRALQFKHAGVAWHPGDQGMQKIADAIWARLKPELEAANP